MARKVGLADTTPAASDILVTIFPYLTATEFLALTTCSKALLSYRQDPTFWRILTRNTFRLPPQPLLQADGHRWQWLYKRLLTQTRVFTWGNNERSVLGQEPPLRDHASGQFRRHPRFRFEKIGWPGRMVGVEHVGTVADIQCGGWCTTLLSSTGAIYGVGGLRDVWDAPHYNSGLERLRFPSAYPPTTKRRYEPSTAIRQYSAGRSHVLGLADSGRIWVWHDMGRLAIFIKPLHVDLMENVSLSSKGRATKVVGGWDRCSIYVNGTGILYWPSDLGFRDGNEEEGAEDSDGLLIDAVTIPGTSHRQQRDERNRPPSLQSRIGEVINHVVLEGFIVFITKLNKVFSHRADFPLSGPTSEPVELTSFNPSTTDPHRTERQILDIQGSFRNFAILTKDGAVLTANTDFLNQFHVQSTSPSPPIPTLIPSLQNTSVISLAFGDYHIHALHANGTISSLGTEPKGCGALGLGSPPLAHLRGVTYNVEFGDGDGHIHSVNRRTIWFEREKKALLEHMCRDPQFQSRGPSTVRETDVMGNYFEDQGKGWADGVELEDGIGAFFALKVSAAGWHSGALVLVDEEKAERVRAKYIVPEIEETEGSEEEAPNHENRGGDEAEGEEIAAPWEQLATTITAVAVWFWTLGRWFLGLEERDRRAGAGGIRRVSETEAARAPRKGDAIQEETVRYVWDERPFPDLDFDEGEGGVGQGE